MSSTNAGQSSRAEESHIARRSPENFLTIESYNGSSSYTIGGDIYKSKVFKQLERVVEIPFSRTGLRIWVVTGSITGNSFKVQFYRNTGTDAIGRFTGEEASATDNSADSFWVIEEGT